MAREEGSPSLIMADFNITPTKLDTVRDLVEDELWEDLGSVADRWGSEPNQPTCKTRAAANATRIDGMLANMWALPYVKCFRVYKDEMITTRSVVEQEESTYVTSLPSLKKIVRRGDVKAERGQGN